MKWLLSIISLCLLPLPGLAMGLGVTPSQLTVVSTIGQLSTEELVVTNNSSEAGIYDVYADDLAEWVGVNPAQFRLSPGESQTVRLQLRPWQAGSFVFNVSVVGRSLKRESFNAAAGLKVPVTLRVTGAAPVNGVWFWPVLIALLVIVVGALIPLYRRRRRSWWQRRLAGTQAGIDWLLHHRQPWYHTFIRYLNKKL